MTLNLTFNIFWLKKAVAILSTEFVFVLVHIWKIYLHDFKIWISHDFDVENFSNSKQTCPDRFFTFRELWHFKSICHFWARGDKFRLVISSEISEVIEVYIFEISVIFCVDWYTRGHILSIVRNLLIISLYKKQVFVSPISCLIKFHLSLHWVMSAYVTRSRDRR